MSNFKPKDKSPRIFIPEILWKKFSSNDRKLIIEYNKKIPPKTWSPSSGNTRTLPNTPRIPDGGKSQSISWHQGQEEGAHESDHLPMKKHLAKLNSCLPWFMKPSMPLLTTHPLILTKFCLSTEPTQLKTPYIFTKAKMNLSLHQQIDRGANGGLAGSDMRVLNHTGHKINIVGTDNHELKGLDEVTEASSLDTNQG